MNRLRSSGIESIHGAEEWRWVPDLGGLHLGQSLPWAGHSGSYGIPHPLVLPPAPYSSRLTPWSTARQRDCFEMVIATFARDWHDGALLVQPPASLTSCTVH